MSKVTIEGIPYSAELIAQEDATQGHSYAYAIVEPPFTADEETFRLVFDGPIVVTPLVETRSKVLLEIDVADKEREVPHEERLEIAKHGLGRLIGLLNEIENGTFKHY